MTTPLTKVICGVTFTEGEIIPVKGVGFLVVKITRRGLALRRLKRKEPDDRKP